MKIHTIKNRWFLPVLSCAALAMTSHSQAAVLVTFEQVGDDVVATWTGSLDAGVLQTQVPFNGILGAAQRSLYALSGSNDFYLNGLAHASSLSGSITSYTGSAGFVTAGIYFSGVEKVVPGSSIYDFDTLGVTQTFGDQTLADIGAASFDDTLAWTSSAQGTNTISYTTIPEPSSTALLGLGALALAVRRRR
jgi:hypothetical protein